MNTDTKAFFHGLLLAANAAIAINGVYANNMAAAVIGSIGATLSLSGELNLIDRSTRK
jgi:hypothetical protein